MSPPAWRGPRARFLAPLLCALALLPGCLSPDAAVFPVHHETREAGGSDLFPGLVVRGTLQGSGEALQVEVLARNDGPRTYRVETGCTTPWTEVVYQGETDLQHRRPVATCLAFAVRDFAPGDNLTYTAEWTGILYDADSDTFHRAPAGTYTWSVRFLAYSGDDGAASVKRFDLDFDVTVQ